MSLADLLNNLSNKIYLYGYILIFIFGLVGNPLEISNLFTLLIYVFPSIIDFIFGKNGTESNLIWCRLINWTSDLTNLISISMLCLASIDRYFSSSRQVQLRQMSSMRIAKISIVIIVFIAFCLSIPDLLYWYIDENLHQCIFSQTYLRYASYFLIPVMFSFVPLVLLSIFGYKTYKNLQQIHRQRLNNQLNRMLISQIILFLFQTTSFFSINLYITITYDYEKSDLRLSIENLCLL